MRRTILPCCHNYANWARYSSRRWRKRHFGTLSQVRTAVVPPRLTCKDCVQGLRWTVWLDSGLVDGSAATGMRGSWMLDLYTVLGLSRRATSDEIKAAYRALAKRHHPDANAGDADGERRTKEVNRAYEIL